MSVICNQCLFPKVLSYLIVKYDNDFIGELNKIMSSFDGEMLYLQNMQ